MSQPQSSLSPTTTTTTTTTTATTAAAAPNAAMAPSSTDLSHFLTIPWCAALLSAPDATLLPTPSRVPKSSTEDSFFALTLRTGDTIPYMLSFSSPRAVAATAPTNSATPTPSQTPSPEPATATAKAKTIEQVSTLFSLGPGINGYPATAHGGVIAALFDEAMGVSMMRLRASAAHPKCPAGGTDIVTASLTVDFVRRLATPGEVVVRVWVSERRGRKWVLEAEMVGVEGVVVGRGRAVWVEVRAGL